MQKKNDFDQNQKETKKMCRNKKFKENYSLLIQTNIHYKFIILLNAFFKQALSVRKSSLSFFSSLH